MCGRKSKRGTYLCGDEDLGGDREALEALQGVEAPALLVLTAADVYGGRVSRLARRLKQLHQLLLHHP